MRASQAHLDLFLNLPSAFGERSRQQFWMVPSLLSVTFKDLFPSCFLSAVIMCLWAMKPADASWKQMHCRLLHSCFPKSFQDRCSSRETLQLAPLFFNPL